MKPPSLQPPAPPPAQSRAHPPAQPRAHSLRRIAPAALVIVWAAGMAVSFGALARYAGKSGAQLPGPGSFPAEAPVVQGVDRPTLVACVTPACPCSRATVGELERIAARADGEGTAAPKIVVIFRQTPGTQAGTSDLWSKARHIPGAELVIDADGTICREFHAKTSGQVLVYDAAGELKFSGGITASRGHAGDSDGGNAVRDVLLNKSIRTSTAPVFGCALN